MKKRIIISKLLLNLDGLLLSYGDNLLLGMFEKRM
jgi:hypothetical protein